MQVQPFVVFIIIPHLRKVNIIFPVLWNYLKEVFMPLAGGIYSDQIVFHIIRFLKEQSVLQGEGGRSVLLSHWDIWRMMWSALC